MKANNTGINLVQKAVRQQAVVNAAKTKAQLLLDNMDAPFSYDSGTFDGGSFVKTSEYKTKSEQIKANAGWVFAANDIIAEGISAVEFEIVQTVKGGDKKKFDEHPILALLDSPVDNMHGMQFLNLHTSYLNLNGESYVIPVGESTQLKGLPAALHLLPAYQVEYKINKDTGNEIIKFGKDDYLENSIDEVKFYRDYRANPQSQLQGKSIVAAAAAAIDTDSKAKRYNQNFFANAARPSMIIQADKQMSAIAYERYKQQLTEFSTGTENAYKPMLIEGNATVTPFALSQKDMDFLSGRKFSMNEILAMFRVSPAMLGLIDNANRANMEAAEYAFAKWVILPRVKAFCKFVNKYIIDPIDPTLQLTYKSFVPDDITTTVNARKVAANTWKTVNEVRKEEGLPDVEGGDQLYIPNSVRALGEPAPAPVVPGVPAVPPAAPAAGDGTPPADNGQPAPQAADNQEVKRLKRAMAKMILQQKRQAELKKKLLNDRLEQRANKGLERVNKMLPLLDTYEQDFMRITRSLFEQQRTDVLNTLIEAMPAAHKSLGIKTKAAGDVQNQLALLFADGQYDIDLSKQLQPVYQTLTAAQLADTFAQLPNYHPPAEVKGIAEFIKERAGMIAKDINAETQKEILLTLAEGFDAGESRTQLTARLNKIFGEMASVRSERIARTESVKAASTADLYGWKQSGIVIAKEWYTPALDACVLCRSMDKKVVELDQTYYEKGAKLTVDYYNGEGEKKQQSINFNYEEIQAPPLHVNCRCTTLPVLKNF